MSDGDSLSRGPTPGRHEHNGDSANPWQPRQTNRTPRPVLGAAPWERAGIVAEPPNGTADIGTGNHTDGVSVADLIARVGGVPAPARRSHRRPDPEPEPDLLPPPPPADVTVPLRAARVTPTQIGDRLPFTRSTTRKRHPVRIIGRVATALISVIALALTGTAWQWNTSKNNLLNRISALDPDSRDIVDPNAQFGDENFLIVGTDSRFGENGEIGAGDTEIAGGARADTIMLVNIPANRERVVVVSFPRDLDITPMLCDAWNPETGEYGPVYDANTGSYGPEEWYTETKLNSAYSYGGPKCLVKVIQKLSGLSINRFMAVDFVGFEKMVDALGGVQVCSTTALQDYELGTVLPRAGWQSVDGRTALNYVRARKVTTEINGDYGRIKRQQLFLSSLLRSMISKEVFYSLSKLNNVVNTFIDDSHVDNIDTKDLVDLGQSIQGVAAGRITFLTVPTTGVMDEWGNEHLRVDDTRALFDAIIDDHPLPGENDSNQTTTPTRPSASPQAHGTPSAPNRPGDGNDRIFSTQTIDPGTVTVHVSNSTSRSGLSTKAAGDLQEHGFVALVADDYPDPLDATTVYFSPGHEQDAATVASALANPQLEQVSGMGDVVEVVLGSDFYAVGKPRPTGSTMQVAVTRKADGGPTALPQDLSITNAADVTCE